MREPTLMPLTINLRHLEDGPIRLRGELSVLEMDLAGLDELVRPAGPLGYDLEFSRQEQGLLVQGRLEMVFTCECARCLRTFEHGLRLEDWSILLPWEGEDRVRVDHDSVDLTPYAREDMVLALPQHPLCGPECSGFPAGSPAGGEQPCAASTSDVSSAWAELNKLKF
jgi:uncharacterized protein